MLLYESRTSGNCWKVRQMLAHRELTYETRELGVIDRSARPGILGGLNPALRVPTLVLDDGRPLAESGAILVHLAEGTPWLPEDAYERALVLQWLFFEQYSHEPHVATARFLVAVHPDEPDPAVLARAHEGGDRALRAMDDHLTDRSWLVGERCTIADIALYAYTHVAGEGGFDLDRYPAVQAWIARVAAEPGHLPMDAGPAGA